MENIKLPFVVSIGIYNAQLAIKNRAVSKNRKTTMFEIELPISDGGMSYIDDEMHPICENTVICAKPGQMRHTRLPFMCYYIHFIINEGALYNTLMDLSNFIEFDNTDRLRSIFVKMCEIYSEHSGDNELLLQSLILELIHLLSISSYVTKSKNNIKNNQKTIENTIEYINNNLMSDLSLERLANMSNFTPTYFHKLFKASTGKPLREYIEDQRIRKSINLMMSTDMTLTQISYECGFSSQSYFSCAFKRKMKLPPREYVNLILKKYEE